MQIWLRRREERAGRSDDGSGHVRAGVRPNATPNASWEAVAIPRQNGGVGGATLAISVRDGALFLAVEEPAPVLAAGTVARLVSFDRYGVRRVALVGVAPDAWAGALTSPLDRPEPLLLNGFPPQGVVTLEDRDELVVNGELLLFAANAMERVQQYVPPEGGPQRCSRCRLELVRGDRVLACSGCGAFAHEGDLASEPPGRPARLSCASYDPCCGACARRLDELVWHPEGRGVACCPEGDAGDEAASPVARNV